MPRTTAIVRARAAVTRQTTTVVRARVTASVATSLVVVGRVRAAVATTTVVRMRVGASAVTALRIGEKFVFTLTVTTAVVRARVAAGSATTAAIDGRVTQQKITTAHVNARVAAATFTWAGVNMARRHLDTTVTVTNRVRALDGSAGRSVATTLVIAARVTRSTATTAQVIGRLAKAVATTVILRGRVTKSAQTTLNLIDLSGRIHRSALTSLTVRTRVTAAVTTSAHIFHYFVPVQMTTLTVARDSGNTATIDLSWAAPGADGTVGMGGGTLAGYTLYRSVNGGAFLTVNTTLIAGTTYQDAGQSLGASLAYQITATNHEIGEGPRSVATATIVPALAPGAPTITGVNQNGSQTLTIVWSAATDNGSPVDFYELFWSVDGGASYVNFSNFSQTTRSWSYTGYQNGYQYYFKLRARNASGVGGAEVEGPFSAIVGQHAAAVPTQVSGFRAVAGDGNVTLYWNFANFNGSDSPVYNILRNGAFLGQITTAVSGTDPYEAPNTWTTAGGYLTYIDRTVANGTAYNYQVAPYGIVNGSYQTPGYTAATPNVVPSGLPATMAAPSVAQNSDGSLSLAWVAPASNGSALTGYRLGRSDGTAFDLGLGTTYIDTAVSIGTTYAYEVLAKNQSNQVGSVGIAGWGNYSPFSASVISAATPDLVAGVAATAGDHQVAVSWSQTNFHSSGTPVYNILRNGSYLDQISTASSGTTGQGNHWSTSGGTVTFTDLLVANGGSYYYQVQPYGVINSSYVTPGPSSYSSMVTVVGRPATMAAPSLTFPYANTKEFVLSWSVPAGNGSAITGYRLLRAPDGVFFDLSGANYTQYYDGSIAWNTYYTYTVLAKNSSSIPGTGGNAGWGDYSPPSNGYAAPTPPLPDAIGTPTVTAQGGQTIRVTWPPITVAALHGASLVNYWVQRSDGQLYSINPQTALFYDEGTVVPGQTYSYQVLAASSSQLTGTSGEIGWGPYSSWVSVVAR